MLLTTSEVIKEFFSRKDGTGRGKITEDKLYRLAKRGEIPSLKLDGRVFFDEDTLREWIKEKSLVNSTTSVLEKYGRNQPGKIRVIPEDLP